VKKTVAARLYVASCDSMGVAKGDHGINPLSYTKNGEKQKKIITGNSTSEFGHKDY